jgi:hypothetical protein
MGFRRILIAGLLAITSSIIVFSAVPVQAAPPPNPVCGLQDQKITDFTKTGPSASVVYDMDGGLIVQTLVNDDSVNWKKTFATPFPFLPAMASWFSYRTKKFAVASGNAAALPAYKIYLTGTDGPNSSTTLIYEPYYQVGNAGLGADGNPKVDTFVTWNVGAGKFWATRTIAGITAEPGGSYAGNKTLDQIFAANPGAKVAAIGIGQGTYNAGTRAWVGTVRFGCATYIWKQPIASPSASVSASASASVSASPIVSVTTTPASLPLTGGRGNAGMTLGLIGLGALSLGVLLFLLTRQRRRTRFVA